MAAVLQVAEDYIDRGWNPVPIPFMQKGPRAEGWQKTVINEINVRDHFQENVEQNIGIILGATSHGLVDVDLDCPEALAIAPFLIPITKAIFGRESKRQSHLLF
jgi:hypothetical protein